MPPRQTFRHNAPDPAARPLAEAMAHHQAGRLAEAERFYRAVLRLAPRHGEALRSLGALYMQSEKVDQALPLLQRAQQAQPSNPEILNNLGVALRQTGRGEEAHHPAQALGAVFAFRLPVRTQRCGRQSSGRRETSDGERQ
jgi:Flp pilus assembly protein TadD